MGKNYCACVRCGHEINCTHGNWIDRHPVATVFIALPTLYTIVGVILAYPWFFIPLLVVVCAWWVNRQQRRRAAIAARADWDYRQAMVRATQQAPARPAVPPGAEQMRRQAWQPDVAAVRPRNPAPWHVITNWPTERFRRQ